MGKRYYSIALVVLVSLAMVGFWMAFLVGQAGAAPPAQEGEAAIPFPNADEALTAAVSWLIEMHQNADGGFASFSTGANQAPSDAGGTLDALLAIRAAGGDTEAILEYLIGNIDDLVAFAATDGSTAGKAVFALSLAGQAPTDFAGHDFVIDVTNHMSPTGEFGVASAFNQSLAILGLAFAAEPIPEEAVDWLVSLQSTEGDTAGSWDDGFGTTGNADSTAMAIMALLASGRGGDSAEIGVALDFLANTRLPTGGWEYGLGFGENANSTALVIQAASAAGEDIVSPDSRWTVDGVTPANALLSWQSESGAFQVDFGDGRFDDFFSTVQTIPAIALISRNDAASAIQEMTPTSTVAPEPAATEAPAEEHLEVSATETPTRAPEPTEAPQPTATPVTLAEAVEAGVDTPEVTDPQSEPNNGPGFAAGDSILPFIMVGLVIAIIIAFFVWLVRNRT
jgi:hypothetical protein